MSAMHEPSTSDPETLAALVDDAAVHALYPEARAFEAGGDIDMFAFYPTPLDHDGPGCCGGCDAEEERRP